MVSYQENRVKNWAQNFRRPIVEADWATFDQYQGKIHQLGIAGYAKHSFLQTSEVGSDVFRALVAYRPARNFLSKLQSWVLTDHSFNMLPFIDAFIGPQLKDVALECYALRSTPETDLHVTIPLLSLTRLSNMLQSLEFRHANSDAFYDSLFGLVTKLPHLRCLVIDMMAIDTEALVYLSDLPFLEVLSGIEIQPEDVELFATELGKFPRLIELTIRTYDFATLPALLDVMRRPLQVLSVGIQDEDTDYNDRLNLFRRATSLLHQYHRLSLRELYLELDTWSHYDHQRSDQAVLDAFHRLFSLSSLTHFDITSLFIESLDNSWIAAATNAWPALRRFCFHNPIDEHRAPIFALESLIPMLKRCSRMESFSMQLELKPLDTETIEGVRNKSIISLFLDRGSTLVHPYHVFRTLTNMFPNLRQIVTSRYYSTPELEKDWKTLENLFQRTMPIEQS